MRNKIAGNSFPTFKTAGITFTYHKYYSPQNDLENVVCSCASFKRTIAKHKGFFTYQPDGSTIIFAVKFIPGLDEFPFIEHINNTLYKDGHLMLGIDTKKQAFFMPVF